MLERYIIGAVSRATFLSLLVLVVLLVFLRLIDETAHIGKGQFDTLDAMLVAVLAAPRHITEMLPMAVLIGSLLGLGGLAGRSELVAMRAAGLSLKRILLAVMQAGLLFMALVMAFGEFVVPSAEEFANAYRLERKEGKVTTRAGSGFWARNDHSFVNVRGVLPGGRLRDIYIHEFDPAGRLRLSSHAATAHHAGDHWVLQDIRQTEIGDASVETRVLEHARWDSLLDPQVLDVIETRASVLPVWVLYQYIQFADAQQLASPDYAVAFWIKVFTPLTILIMVFLAVPFVLGNQRTWSMGQRIGSGVLLGILFYSLNRGMSYSAVVYDIPPLAAAAVPGLVFALLGYWLLRRVS